jgi:predicted RNase H-like HicB family nuclease
MKRARYKTLGNGTCFGQIPGLAGVWANESTPEGCRQVLQEVLEEWLVLKIRDHDPIPRLGRAALPSKAA